MANNANRSLTLTARRLQHRPQTTVNFCALSSDSENRRKEEKKRNKKENNTID